MDPGTLGRGLGPSAWPPGAKCKVRVSALTADRGLGHEPRRGAGQRPATKNQAFQLDLVPDFNEKYTTTSTW